MKKLLILCSVAAFTSGYAQTSDQIIIDKLIKSKTFAIVVSEVKKKGPFEKTFYFNPSESQYVNLPPTLSPAQSLAITSIPVGARESAIKEFYYTSNAENTPFNNVSLHPIRKVPSANESVFLIQSPETVMLKPENPINVIELSKEAFKTTNTTNYKLKSSQKKNGTWVLVYSMKEDKNDRKLYVNVHPDGKVELQDNPTLKGVTLLSGYIAKVVDERK